MSDVSKQSQAKRAARAKARAKQRARSEHSNTTGNQPSDPGDGVRSAHGLSLGDPDSWDREESRLRDRTTAHDIWLAVESGRLPVHRAVALAAGLDEQAFCDMAEVHLRTGIERAYISGYTPSEVIRQVRLSAGTSETELCRWAIAADHDTRRGQRITSQWSADVKLEATTAYVPKSDWTLEWSGVQPSRDAARATMFILIAVLAGLGALDVIMQPPSGITPWSPVVGHDSAAHDPVLNQIRALLAKAESTEFEAEASAFTAKAQQLMTKHAIDHAVLNAGRRDPGTPSITRIPLDPPYADAKASLLHVVADHMRCRAIQISRVKMATVVGADVDLEAVNLMFTSLLVQAQHALSATSAGSKAGSRERSQRFRSSFLSGFTQRISERLQEANEQVYAADDRSDKYLPVLRAKDDALDDFINERYSLTTKQGRGAYDGLGYSRGQAAGDRARFGSEAISP